MKKTVLFTVLAVLILTLVSSCDSAPGNEAESAYDVDLTKMSSTMVYAEVYNIVNTPDDYMGKTIKVKGTYGSQKSDVVDATYHFIVISDATACCAQGLEFIWDGHGDAEYPPDGTEIELIGEYSTYLELGNEYPYINAKEMFFT